jgi:hypothetical protein
MSHELHDGCEVHSYEDQAGSKGVTQVVETAGLNTCSPDRPCKGGLDCFDWQSTIDECMRSLPLIPSDLKLMLPIARTDREPHAKMSVLQI